MDWEEVVTRHGSPAAVNVRDGRVASVLCGGAGHADTVKGDTVLYSVPKRPFYARTVRALESCAAEGTKFTVFSKIKQNDWQDLGLFRVSAISPREQDILFTLVSSEPRT